MDIIAFVLGSQVIMIMRDYDRTHRRRTARLISWIFPCFVLLLFLSYMIATACMIVSELLSDLCIGVSQGCDITFLWVYGIVRYLLVIMLTPRLFDDSHSPPTSKFKTLSPLGTLLIDTLTGI